MSIEKMSTVEAIEVRKTLYSIATEALNMAGVETQPVKGGSLITLNDGHFAKLAISVCDPSKVDGYIAEYAEQQAKNAQRAAEAAAKAEEKARKAAERAAKRAANAGD